MFKIDLDLQKNFTEIRFNLKFVFILVLVYFYIFQPPVFSKYTFVIVYFILSFFILLKYGMPFISRFKNEFLILFLVVFFPLARDLISGEIVYSDRFLFFFLQTFIFGYFISIYILKEKIPFLPLLFFASLIAAFSTVLSFSFTFFFLKSTPIASP